MTGLFPDNEGLESVEKANQQNNDHKSTACDTPLSTEEVDWELQNKEVRVDQEIQEETDRTNNPDKDRLILTSQPSDPQIIKETSTTSARTSNPEHSPSIEVELSKKTTINQENDVVSDTDVAYCQQQTNSASSGVEQASYSPTYGSEEISLIPEISNQTQSDTSKPKTAPTKTAINEPLGTIASILPEVAYGQQTATVGYVEQATDDLQASESELERVPNQSLSSCHLPPDTPSPATDTKNAPLSAAGLNDARNEGTGHSPPIIKTSAASTTHAVDSQATNNSQLANQVIIQIMRHVRYLLTLKGRPPLRLVGIFMYQRLWEVCNLLDDLLRHRYDFYLNSLRDGLKTALAPYGDQFNELLLASTWLNEISNILEPVEMDPRSSEEVAEQLRDYLNQRLSEQHENQFLISFVLHLDNTSLNYWPGLFHTYDYEFLPSSNNEIESHFRDTQRRLLRTTGQKGLTKRTLHRYGAWELLPRPPTEAERLEGFLQVSLEALKIEQKRLAQHLQRFDMDTRSPNLLDAKFQKLRDQWFNLPPDAAG